MSNDNWGEQVHDAIARRDATTLRQMARTADREETSMWLTLLAGMLEADAARSRRPAARPGRLAIASPIRRVSAAGRAR